MVFTAGSKDGRTRGMKTGSGLVDDLAVAGSYRETVDRAVIVFTTIFFC